MKKFAGRSSGLKLSTALFKGSFVHNPVLTQVIGVCPIVAAATSVKNAAVISAVLFLALALCEVLSSLWLKRFSSGIRICLYCLLASAVSLPASSLVGGKTLSALGVFLPLLSLNAIIVVRCEKFAIKTGAKNSFFDAVASAVGFGAVALIVGFFRELFAFGTVFSLKLSSLPTFSAVALPFGGLVLLGFLAAAHKAIVLKFFPQELTDTFNFSKVFEKPVLRDPGLGEKGRRKPSRLSDDSNAELDLLRPRHSSDEGGSKEGEE